MIKGDLKTQTTQCVAIQWTIAGVALLFCGAIAFLSLRPTAGQLGQLQRHLAAQRAELAVNRARAASMAPLQRENDQLQQQAKTFDQRLGRPSELPHFIADVADVARKSSLRNLTWRSDAQQSDADQLIELPIQFSFQSEYTGASDFLRKVSELPRITSVQKVSMKALPGADGSAGWVDVQLTMNVYFEGE
jgi:Tfp pilus assembly protein PilO